MPILAQVLIAIVAILHVGFLVLEMFLWDTPRGRRAFNTRPEFSKESKVLAANQGLYNGFLAAGLIWSLMPIGAEDAAPAIASFFLVCVIVAGLYGMATVSHRILYVQALPAIIALTVLWLV